MLQLTTFPTVTIAVDVLANLNLMKTLTSNNPDDAMTIAVNALPIEKLRKLQDGFHVSNREDVADVEV